MALAHTPVSQAKRLLQKVNFILLENHIFREDYGLDLRTQRCFAAVLGVGGNAWCWQFLVIRRGRKWRTGSDLQPATTCCILGKSAGNTKHGAGSQLPSDRHLTVLINRTDSLGSGGSKTEALFVLLTISTGENLCQAKQCRKGLIAF